MSYLVPYGVKSQLLRQDCRLLLGVISNIFFALAVSNLFLTAAAFQSQRPTYFLARSQLLSPNALSRRFSRSDDDDDDIIVASSTDTSLSEAFVTILSSRYACTRFRPYSSSVDRGESTSPLSSAGDPNPAAVLAARRVLTSCVATVPSGFNSQPYRAVMVSSAAGRSALSAACIGRNADRVRQSDVSVVFLADRECGRTMGEYIALMEGEVVDQTPRLLRRKYFKVSTLIFLFSSGYPLPRIFAVPLSFCLRCGVAAAQFVLRRLGSASFLARQGLVLPTLGSAETWSYKNTMLFAMSYMLGMTAKNIETCPMEGYDAGMVRRALGVTGRYGVPIIVCAGTAYKTLNRDSDVEVEKITDDVGVKHGSRRREMEHGGTPRYKYEEMVKEI
uniref:Nitroreductase domain-containing protein n=1 Tax=Corethron hystrix TaxID=216773 RepID=A0A7S1BMT4_9STRA|mmetsp:Transcript_32746/g.75350  ORF Transcript_32746/g.75350 Transcript_32746/m.75350 type:complete len:390 (+) Transcript_32746:51-1220(+)